LEGVDTNGDVDRVRANVGHADDGWISKVWLQAYTTLPH
jgi:hypothetical protein